MVAIGLYAFVIRSYIFSVHREMFHYQDKHFMKACVGSFTSANCYEREIIGKLYIIVPVIAIPLKEILFLPIITIKQCRVNISILQKIVFGLMLLPGVRILSLGTEVASLRQKSNSSVTCILHTSVGRI